MWQSLYVLTTSALTGFKVSKPKVWAFIIQKCNTYGVIDTTPNPQNDRSTADEPVHNAIKAVFVNYIRSSIGLQHILAPDGHSRRPTYRTDI